MSTLDASTASNSLHNPACRPTFPPTCTHLPPLALPRRYELHSEFDEALEHALERGGRNTKVVLKVSDVGEQY